MKMPNALRHELHSRMSKKAVPEPAVIAPTQYDAADYTKRGATIRLSLDNEIKDGSYWARQPNPKVRTMIADKGRPVDTTLTGAKLGAVLEAARKTDRKPWWNESQQRWFIGADTAEAWANVNR